MAWTWKIWDGALYEPDGERLASGYSGLGEARNNGQYVRVEGRGPIPPGDYDIGAPYNSKRVGPFALPLTPREGTETFGRSAFRIHGDSIAHPGTASHGCIILPRAVRETIAASGDKVLHVAL